MKYTLKDVASMAQTSKSTVSRYLNGNTKIDKDTQIRIKEACKKLNYRVNMMARTLKTKKTNIIAIIVPTMTNAFFVELCNYIQLECMKYNLTLVICNIQSDKNIEKCYIQMINDFNFDGVIICTGLKEKYDFSNINVVQLDRLHLDSQNYTLIRSDHYLGSKIAIDYLVKNSCKKILYVITSKDNSSAKLRLNAIEDFIKNNLNIKIDIYKYKNHNELKNFKDYRNYDGVITWNDDIAIIIVNILLSKNIKIPEDIQIIGFDNTFASKDSFPKITTISQDYEKLAKLTIEKLINKINNNDSDYYKAEYVIPVNLIKRDTTK